MINLLFFGRLGDCALDADKSIFYQDDLATPLDVRDWLAKAHGDLGQVLSEPQVLVSVNKRIVKWDHPLADNDELAFLPPVTGG